jgi:hypothetical protein
MSPVLPNLIIPGGQKCGSSSLAHYLSLHPDCFLTTPKEPSFFSRYLNLLDLERYQPFVQGYAGQAVLAEASTGYLYETYAAARIARTLGRETKVAIILRNPVERTLSAFLHQRKRFTERRDLDEISGDLPGDPSEAFVEEERRIVNALRSGRIDVGRYEHRYDDSLWQFRYLRNSWYEPFIRSYIEQFGRERVLVIFLERLNAHPEATMERVFAFLNLPPIVRSNFRDKMNATLLPRGVGYFGPTGSGLLASLAAKHPRYFSRLAGMAPLRLRPGEEERLRPIRQNLQDILERQCKGLSELLGEDVGEYWARRQLAVAGR